MKFTVEKSVLLPALSAAAKVAGNKLLPVLDDILIHVHIDGIGMTVGNGEVSLQASIYGAEVEKEGSATIPAKKLHEIVNKLPAGKIEFETKGLKTVVKGGKSKTDFAGVDTEMYPEFPRPFEPSVKIRGEDFKDMVKRTRYAVAVDGNSPILTGVKFDLRGPQLTATGCDRHRLSLASKTIESPTDVVVCVVKGVAFKDLLTMIDDNENLEVFFEKSAFFVQTKDYVFHSRVLDGTYPDTSKLIPQSFTTHFDVDTKEFRAAVERALIIALDDKKNIVTMSIGEDITITSEGGNNKAYETVEAEIVGQPLKVSYNGKYMVEALSTIETKTVRICFNGQMQPFVMRTEGTEDYQVLLPYRTH